MAPACMEDFALGTLIARGRCSEHWSGDVVSANHMKTGRDMAMRRMDVDEPARAQEILQDHLRGAELRRHPNWLGTFSDLAFVETWEDGDGGQQGRVVLLEELATISLHDDLVDRSVGPRPYENIWQCFAKLLHGLQAFHAQGCLHRALHSRNIFFSQAGSLKIGPPGPLCRPARSSSYADGHCPAYSSDILALGLVFVEMALLHAVEELDVPPMEFLRGLRKARSAAEHSAAIARWITDLGRKLSLSSDCTCFDDAFLQVACAMLAWPPESRPTADDLLDWPAFAIHVDPEQVLPPRQRPCVVLAHRSGMDPKLVPRRQLVMLPEFHQLCSSEGAQGAIAQRCYRWCGRDAELWWACVPDAGLDDVTQWLDADLREGLRTPLTSRPLRRENAEDLLRQERPGMDAVIACARQHRAASRPLAAEALCRAALAVSEGPSDLLLELCAAKMEQANYMAARLLFDTAVQYEGDRSAPMGLCELFNAVEALRDAGVAAASRARSSMASHDGEASDRSTPVSALSVLDQQTLAEATEQLRGEHRLRMYKRSSLAEEAGDWQMLAGLGEFYRWIGCPEAALERPAPDLATALSYLERAQTICDGQPFVADRLAKLVSASRTELAASPPLPPPAPSGFD